MSSRICSCIDEIREEHKIYLSNTQSISFGNYFNLRWIFSNWAYCVAIFYIFMVKSVAKKRLIFIDNILGGKIFINVVEYM